MSSDTPVSFRLSAELEELIEERADAEGVSFSEKVREYCREGVDGNTRDNEVLTDELS